MKRDSTQRQAQATSKVRRLPVRLGPWAAAGFVFLLVGLLLSVEPGLSASRVIPGAFLLGMTMLGLGWLLPWVLPQGSFRLAQRALSLLRIGLLGGLAVALHLLLLVSTLGGHRLSPQTTALVAGVTGLTVWLLSLAQLLDDSRTELFEAEAQARLSELRAKEAELASIEAQLRPHFLFNTLNSIAYLAAREPLRARQMCVDLGELLRTGLNLPLGQLHSLEEELELARKYLSLEAARFGERCRAELELTPAVLSVAVPPLVLQPLLENALRHGDSESSSAACSIRAEAKDGQLLLSLRNPRRGAESCYSAYHTGRGLELLGARLHRLYGESARLSQSGDESSYCVQLLLPVSPDSARVLPRSGSSRERSRSPLDAPRASARIAGPLEGEDV